MDKAEIKVVIEWCDEMGHSEHEILDLIRRIVSANPRKDGSGKDNGKTRENN